nr:nitronate monooxygenase [Anaerosphaera multitolerans]
MVKRVSLRMVNQVSKAVKIPVMGLGGVTTWEDAVEFIMAGATVVQVGTASFIKPSISLDIIDKMRDYAEREKLNNISDIRGII